MHHRGVLLCPLRRGLNSKQLPDGDTRDQLGLPVGELQTYLVPVRIHDRPPITFSEEKRGKGYCPKTVGKLSAAESKIGAGCKIPTWIHVSGISALSSEPAPRLRFPRLVGAFHDLPRFNRETGWQHRPPSLLFFNLHHELIPKSPHSFQRR